MTQTPALIPIGMGADEGVRAILGGLARSGIYRLINAGELTKVNIGKRGFITAESLNAYLARIGAAA